MATKDSDKSVKEITERRLKNVFVLIDESNFRGALQQIDKLAKKHGTNSLSNSLKALSLAKLKKRNDSLAILNEMKITNQDDIDVLHNMSKSFKELNLSEEIPPLFIQSLQINPKNQELLTYLFFSYVFNDNFLQQKQISMELHKLSPKVNLYYFWATVSIMLQFYTSTDDKMKVMFLNYSQKMISNRVNLIQSLDEFKLYVRVLFFQENYSSILEIMETTGVKFIDNLDILNLKVQCQENLCKWTEMFDTHKTILHDNNDQWFAYDGMIRASISKCLSEKKLSCDISQKCTTNSQNSYDADNTQEVESNSCSELTSNNELIEQLIKICNLQKENDTSRNRSPYLAQILLLIQIYENNITSCSYPDLLSTLDSFYNKFALKPSAFQDLVSLILRLPQSIRDQFLSHIENNKTSSSNNNNQFDLYSHELNLLLLSRHLGRHQLLDLENLKQTFQQTILLQKITDPSTVNRFLLASIHIMYDSYLLTGDVYYLLEALCWTNLKQQDSSTDYNILLLSLRIHGMLGCADMCIDSFSKLGLKHLQIDTLGYLFEHSILQSGNFNCLYKFNSLVLEFYQNNDHEISEFLNESYKTGSYDKVYDIYKLRHQLRNSYFKRSCLLNSYLLKWLLEINCVDINEQLDYLSNFDMWRKLLQDSELSLLYDNRDLNILRNCSPHQWQITKFERNITFQLEILWIKFRLCLINSAEYLFHLARQENIANSDYVTKFDQSLINLEQILRDASLYSKYQLTDFNTNLSKIPRLYLPPTALIELFVQTHWFSNPVYLILKITQNLVKCLEGQETINWNNELNYFQTVINNSFNFIQSQSITENFTLQVNYLRNLTAFTIQLSIICNTLIPCYLLIKSCKKQSQKSFTIEDENFTCQSLFKHISTFISNICALFLVFALKEEESLRNLDINNIKSKLPLQTFFEKEFAEMFSKSRSTCLQEILNNLTESLKQIISLMTKKSQLIKQLINI